MNLHASQSFLQQMYIEYVQSARHMKSKFYCFLNLRYMLFKLGWQTFKSNPIANIILLNNDNYSFECY